MLLIISNINGISCFFVFRLHLRKCCAYMASSKVVAAIAPTLFTKSLYYSRFFDEYLMRVVAAAADAAAATLGGLL